VEGESLADAHPGPPHHHNKAAQPTSVRAVSRFAQDPDYLFDPWWSAGYRRPLFRGGRPAWNPGLIAGERRRATAGAATTPPLSGEP
jgi:hypothetical protein